MTIKCPYCGATMTSEAELTKGQHVLCPCCKLKFTFGEEWEATGYVEAKFWSMVGRCPWTDWLKRANGLVAKGMPFALGLVAVAACATWFVALARQNAPVSAVFKPWLTLVVMVCSAYVSRRAMALPCRTMEGCARLTIRPQMAYILKVAVTLGLIICGCSLAIDQGDRDSIIAGVSIALTGVAWGVCLEKTSLLRIKVGMPANCVEEAVALLLLPVRFLIAVLPIALAATVVVGAVYAFAVFNGDGVLIATVLAGLVTLPTAVSLVVHLYYVFSNVALELMKAEVSLPAKLDALRSAPTAGGKPSSPIPPTGEADKTPPEEAGADAADRPCGK